MPLIKRETGEICGVCGGPNAVVHFGAITCRACGAFFRRNVALGITFECLCSGQDPGLSFLSPSNNILACKGCRQRKCLEIGMNKELVRAAKLQAFHRERKRMVERDLKNASIWTANLYQIDIFRTELEEMKFVERLMEIGDLAKEMFRSRIVVPDEYFERNKTLEAILGDKNNLLANSEKLVLDQHESLLSNEEVLNFVWENGLYGGMSRLAAKAYLVGVNLAKTMPAFHQLAMQDQIALVKGSCSVFCFFFANFHSAKLNSPVLLGAIRGSNFFEIYSLLAKRYSDPIILNASGRIFHRPICSFGETKLLSDEFVLLMAMAFSNSAIFGLSDHAHHLLKEHEEKYGRALLRLQQRRMGIEAGARRYTETLGLLWTTINQAQNLKELAIYVDTRYERDRYRRMLPKALVPLLE